MIFYPRKRRTFTLVAALSVAALLLVLTAGCDTARQASPTTDAGEIAAPDDSESTEGTSDPYLSDGDQVEEEEATPKKAKKRDCNDITVPDPSEAKGAGNKIAVIKTKKGTIKFKFYPKEAPIHVANFIQLAECGFYDGLKFHRVISGFVAQGGDPTSLEGEATGAGGTDYTVPAEYNSNLHVDGTVAAARTADNPDSSGSQFYIALGALPSLDNQYTVYGQVIDGLDVVHKIQKGDVMTSVTIIDKK